MLSREHIHTLIQLRHCKGNFFSKLPGELIEEIIDVEPVSNSDIAKALHHAAFARQEDVDALLEMLEANPRLLLEAGNVITPGGDELRRVTIYECLLGAGDYALAEMVQGYFSEIKDVDGQTIEDAEVQRIRQYERYKPHIEGMLTQKPYNLEPLIKLIKKATTEEVAALLNKDFTGENDLCKAIIQFRKDWAPRVLVKPGMHYNYASLKHAFELLDREWNNLYQASGNNFNKVLLVWRQLIGFEMRRLPGIDRCAMAQGLYYVIDQHEEMARSYKFKNDDGDFPIVATDDSLDGLGGDFSVNIFGAAAKTWYSVLPRRSFCLPAPPGRIARSARLENLCRTKTSNLQSLCSPSTDYVNNLGV